MDKKMLDYRIHTDTETGCLCRYVKSDDEYFRLHYHNYYELFMVLKGETYHVVNGKEQRLREGQILFIRDFDDHDYKSVDGNSFEIVNLAFTKETLFSLFQYLGEGFPADNLLKAETPPIVNLSQREKEILFYSFMELNQGADKAVVKLKARTLILKIFTEYFLDYEEKKTEIPLWLEMTWERMKNPKNFIAGAERMYEISGKSREHLSRSLKKYYNTSPSALISDLRLEHSANLILTSNLSITEICFECGFENLSWFYKQFVKKFGMTPVEYRKKYE